MDIIEQIFNDFKNDKITITDAKQNVIEHILNKPKCDNLSHSDIKYLQWQDRWFCCHCCDTIGDTSYWFEGYKNNNDE